MSVARRPKAASSPAALDVQLAAVSAAVAAADAAHRDADQALADLAAAFIRDPAVLAAYTQKHAEFVALSELRSDLMHHQSEIREALKAARDCAAADAAKAKRHAEAKEAGRIAALPGNADTYARSRVMELAHRAIDNGKLMHLPIITGPLIDIAHYGKYALGHCCRPGREGEAPVVIENAAAFEAYLEKHWRRLLAGHLGEISDIEHGSGSRRTYSPSQGSYIA